MSRSRNPFWKFLLVSVLALIFLISSFSIPTFATSSPYVNIIQEVNGTAAMTNAFTGLTITDLNASDWVVAGIVAQRGSGTTSVTSVSNLPGGVSAILITHIHDGTNFNRDFWIYYFKLNSTTLFNPQFNLNQTVGVNGFIYETGPFTSGTQVGFNETASVNQWKLSAAVTVDQGAGLIAIGGFNTGHTITSSSGWTTSQELSGDSPAAVELCQGYQSNTASTSSSFFAGTLDAFINIDIAAIQLSNPIVTVTLTVTAWNTIDNGTPTTWIVSALFIFLVPSIFWGVLKAYGGKPSNLIFTTLLGLTIGGLLGTISGVELGANAIFPLGITLFFGISLGVYVVRSRSRGLPVA